MPLILYPVVDPDAIPVAGDDSQVVSALIQPDATRNEGRVVAKRQAVIVNQMTIPTIELRIPGFSTRQLIEVGGGSSESSSSLPSSPSFTGRIVAKLGEPFSCDHFTADAHVVDAINGVVHVPLSTQITADPVILQGNLGVFEHTDSTVPASVHTFWVLVDRNFWGDNQVNRGIPSIASIRDSMRDNAPEDHYLLRTLMFDLTEMIESLVRMIRRYNEARPPVGNMTSLNFPGPNQLIGAVTGDLFGMLRSYHLGEHLPYQAGGVAIDDHAKFVDYERISKDKLQEYDRWVFLERRARNAAAFSGTLGGPPRWTY
jgi:hypothetical protein